MAIVTKGSGGSIKFSGTGGSLSITSSGGGGGGPVSPIDPENQSGLSMHYMASSIIINPYYQQLPEVQGRAPTFSPLYGTYNASSTSFNNQPVITISGGNTIVDGNIPAPAASTARTFYFVGMLTNVSATGDVFSYGWDGLVYKGWFRLSLANGEIRIRSYHVRGGLDNNSWQTVDSQAQPISINTPFIVSYSFQADTDVSANTMYVNGAAASGTAGTPGIMYTSTDGVDPTKVGNGRIAFSDWNVGNSLILAETAVFDSAHNSTVRQGIESHLAAKYGITLA